MTTRLTLPLAPFLQRLYLDVPRSTRPLPLRFAAFLRFDRKRDVGPAWSPQFGRLPPATAWLRTPTVPDLRAVKSYSHTPRPKLATTILFASAGSSSNE